MQDIDFLHKIASDPEPDLPRLIYADWLEERGDPRAEFIRIQCERAQLHPSEPRHQELLKREDQLLRWYRNDWVRDVYLDLGLPSGKFTFHRGVIEEAQFRVEVLLKYGPAVFAALPTLRQLEILRIREEHLQLLQRLRCLSPIRGLTLESQRRELPASWLEMILQIPCMPRLKALDVTQFGYTSVGSIFHPAMDQLPDLEVLSLRANWNEDYHLLTSDTLLPRLHVLRLGHLWHRQEWWEVLLNREMRLEQLAIQWEEAYLEPLLTSPWLRHLHTLQTNRYEWNWVSQDERMEYTRVDRFAPDQVARLQARFGVDCLRDVYVPWI